MSRSRGWRFACGAAALVVGAVLAAAPAPGALAAEPGTVYVVQGLPGMTADITIDGARVAAGVRTKTVVGPLRLAPGRHRGPDPGVRPVGERHGHGDRGREYRRDRLLVGRGGAHPPDHRLPERPHTRGAGQDPPGGDARDRRTARRHPVGGKVLFRSVANGESLSVLVPAGTYSVKAVATLGGQTLLPKVKPHGRAPAPSPAAIADRRSPGTPAVLVHVLPVPVHGRRAGRRRSTPGAADRPPALFSAARADSRDSPGCRSRCSPWRSCCSRCVRGVRRDRVRGEPARAVSDGPAARGAPPGRSSRAPRRRRCLGPAAGYSPAGGMSGAAASSGLHRRRPARVLGPPEDRVAARARRRPRRRGAQGVRCARRRRRSGYAARPRRRSGPPDWCCPAATRRPSPPWSCTPTARWSYLATRVSSAGGPGGSMAGERLGSVVVAGHVDPRAVASACWPLFSALRPGQVVEADRGARQSGVSSGERTPGASGATLAGGGLSVRRRRPARPHHLRRAPSTRPAPLRRQLRRRRPPAVWTTSGHASASSHPG